MLNGAEARVGGLNDVGPHRLSQMRRQGTSKRVYTYIIVDNTLQHGGARKEVRDWPRREVTTLHSVGMSLNVAVNPVYKPSWWRFPSFSGASVCQLPVA